MTSNTMLPFGQWLKQRRKMLGLTQAALAEQAACAVVTIKKIERGDLQPSRQLAELLAAYLDVPNGVREAFIQFARSSNRISPVSFQLPPHFTAASFELPDEPHFHIPASLTELIGREHELTSVVERLRRPDVRLLTLTGPPGAGKTRLSLQTATILRPNFRHGIHFIELAPLTEPGQVLEAVAQACNVRETTGRPLKKALLSRLQDRQMLLVLDNFEQVIAAASLVGEILAHAKGVKILITSREALSLYGEHHFPLGPLATPDLNALLSLQDLRANPAVYLFLQRAQAAWPDFQLTEANAADIAGICVQLDGLPLALEMAAAQVRWLAPDKLRGQLQARLAALRGQARDLPRRQRSLRGAIEWSYDRLDDPEKLVFERMAVFADGSTVEAACAVLENQTDKEFLPPKLESLIHKNLIQYTPPYHSQSGEPRIWMLETIRAFAWERLEASGQFTFVKHLHAAYYLNFAETIHKELDGLNQAYWHKQLEGEYNNLRLALRWYVTVDPMMGLRLVTALQSFWITYGYLSEGRAWLAELLKWGQEVPDLQRAQALSMAGKLAERQDDADEAEANLGSALSLFRTLGETLHIADTLCNLAYVSSLKNRYSQLETFANEALTLYRGMKHTLGMVSAINILAVSAKEQGNYPRAITYHEEGLALCRTIDHTHGIAAMLLHLGYNFYWQGDYARAAELSEQSLQLFRSLNHKANIAAALETVAMSAYKLGDPTHAREGLLEGLRLFQEVESKSGEAMVLADMGLVSFSLRETESSIQHFRNSLQLSYELGDKRRMAFCLEGLAEVWGTSDPARAACLLGAAHTLRNQIQSPLPPGEQAGYDLTFQRVQNTLGQERFVKNFEQGCRYTLDQVLEAA